ncbi:MAG: DNA gyrase inhibitor YacG [Acidobacteria bacterium]|nr:MAG: DNA gyrase inhibitor YacG [Acidobacteriota bacterium]
MVGLRTPEALCVYCRQRPIDPAWQPFCSERCKMADLGRWLGGEYCVPTDTPASEADEEEE